MPYKDWERIQEGKLYRRVYPTYEEYLASQAQKLDKCPRLRKALTIKRDLLKRLPKDIIEPGMSVLCLGARLGGEVEAFIELGCFAVGIDINPWPKGKPGYNSFVVYGDFHDLQYANTSIDVVYTNSMDHALYPERVASEAARVLKPSGIFIAENKIPADIPGSRSDRYDCLEWSSEQVLVDTIEEAGFTLERTYPIGGKWLKTGYVFRKGKLRVDDS